MNYKDFYVDILKENCGCGPELTELDTAYINEMITILEKNTPTSPDKWAKAKAAARAKFDVYPSAYANLWASKKYKSMGGKWKRGKK